MTTPAVTAALALWCLDSPQVTTYRCEECSACLDSKGEQMDEAKDRNASANVKQNISQWSENSNGLLADQGVFAATPRGQWLAAESQEGV